MDGFRHTVNVSIRYGDMDSLGHVNHAKFLTYIEHGRVQYAADLGLWDGSLSQFGLILARVTVDYKLPLTTADQQVTVWTQCSRLGSKSFDLSGVIVRERNGVSEIAAEATTVMVVYDYQTNQSVAIPETWRSAITSYEPLMQA